jgi:hypothetical protein
MMLTLEHGTTGTRRRVKRGTSTHSRQEIKNTTEHSHRLGKIAMEALYLSGGHLGIGGRFAEILSNPILREE